MSQAEVCLGAQGRPTPHPWIRLEQEALDRLARFSKMALDAGVAERQTRITERPAAAALEDGVAPLGLPAEQRSAMVQRFVRALTALEQTVDDA